MGTGPGKTNSQFPALPRSLRRAPWLLWLGFRTSLLGSRPLPLPGRGCTRSPGDAPLPHPLPPRRAGSAGCRRWFPWLQTAEHRRARSLRQEVRRGPCHLCLCPHPASPPACLCPNLPRPRRTLVTPGQDPAWYGLLLIDCVCKDPIKFPNKVPFTASVTHDFWGTLPKPVRSESPSSPTSEIREQMPEAGGLVRAADTAEGGRGPCSQGVGAQ